MSARPSEKIRDAERSRETILEAAERLFAERGYEGASLNDIAGEAGLSRGTPSYFFGSKEQLYVDVLDRAFRARQEATRAAFEPVHDWCASEAGPESLRAALARAAEDYVAFLGRHPNFVRLVMQEELNRGELMQRRAEPSTAMHDAFTALRRQGRRRGLSNFKVDDAILLFVGLTFTPASYSHTLMRAVERDLARPAARRRQVELAVDQLMHLIAP
jgi:AcrR family transcriptional regulator